MKWKYLEREARVIYLLTIDGQPMLYWATKHLLARLYFNSNTQAMTKTQVYPSDVSSFSFPPVYEKKSRKDL